MIVTLTPNPSVDRTVTLAGRLERGAVLRAVSATSEAGGKGVNISRAAARAGLPTLAVLPAEPHDRLVADLSAAGIEHRLVPGAGEVRVNLTIAEPDGTTTKLNTPGATVDADLLAALSDALLDAATAGDWAVLAGSVPPGTPREWYAGLVAALRASGTRVAVDTSDEPLRGLVERFPDSAPDLLKPNAEELASLTGGDPAELEDDPLATARAADVLVGRGVGAVLATLGHAGAVLVTRDGAWHAPAPATTVLSTVGAGDSSLFGYLFGDLKGLPPHERLALAVAYGSAAAGLPGSAVPSPSQVHPDPGSVTPLPLGNPR